MLSPYGHAVGNGMMSVVAIIWNFGNVGAEKVENNNVVRRKENDNDKRGKQPEMDFSCNVCYVYNVQCVYI